MNPTTRVGGGQRSVNQRRRHLTGAATDVIVGDTGGGSRRDHSIDRYWQSPL